MFGTSSCRKILSIYTPNSYCWDTSGKEQLYSKSQDSMKNGCLGWTQHGKKHWFISEKSEQWQQMLALPPKQSPLTDQDPDSFSHKLGSLSEILQDLCRGELYYKQHSSRLLLDPATSRDRGQLAEGFWLFFLPRCIQHVFAFTFAFGQSLFIHSANTNHSSLVGTPSPSYSPWFLEM